MLYYKTTDNQRKNGHRWYQQAHQLAKTLAEVNRITIKQSAGILAVLSPMVRWSINRTTASEICSRSPISNYTGYKANIIKAFRILDGEPCSKVLGGWKVRSFYLNILRPHGPQVTIDSHMLRVLKHKGTYDGFFHSKKAYHKVVNKITKEAKLLNIVPNQLQATLWLYQQQITN